MTEPIPGFLKCAEKIYKKYFSFREILAHFLDMAKMPKIQEKIFITFFGFDQKKVAEVISLD